MSKVLITESYLENIADAIRAKNGSQDEYTPGEMSEAINNLPGNIPEWGEIGYSSVPQSLIDNFNYAKNIYDNWTPAVSLMNKYQQNYDLVYFPSVDTSITTNMQGMFNWCQNLESVPLLNTDNVTNMGSMFNQCNKLKTIPHFNTSKVTTMQGMFSNCSSLISIPLLDTSKAPNMLNFFAGCTNLTTVPLLDISSATNLSSMFYGCPSLNDDSLDNILQMCIGATSYAGTKTLTTLGFNTTNYPASRIQALPHYQNFINAGWTIGY